MHGPSYTEQARACTERKESRASSRRQPDVNRKLLNGLGQAVDAVAGTRRLKHQPAITFSMEVPHD